MIAVDTNLLVRYAVKDDQAQTAAATIFLREHACFIHITVLLELVWVLASPSGYRLSREVVLERVRHILGLPTIEVEDSARVAKALEWHERGIDFVDALHLAASDDMEGFATLDRRLVSAARDMVGMPPVILLSEPQA